MSSIIGTCEKCGHKFDVLLGFNCPACRVRKAFAPIDSLRTAMGIQGLSMDAELDGVWHWHGKEVGDFYRGMQQAETEVPRECKIPQGEEAQVYELKRRFRL